MIPIDSSGNRGGTKPPSDEDGALWDHVVRDIKPLKTKNAAGGGKIVAPALPKTRRNQGSAVPVARLPAPVRKPGDQEVDRRTDQKLKRGQYSVDITLDLHGLTQDAAHRKLLDVVRRGYARDMRCILVITGKGRGEGQGVLRRKVPEWLGDPTLHSIILRFYTAQPADGGEGALYVLLRRKRTAD